MSGSTFRGDPYQVLDVRHDASAEDIKQRWRELAREHHPDRASADRGVRERQTTRMARINAAYDVLRDPVRRARYDSSPEARRNRTQDADATTHAPGGPPPPTPTRPVTARFDTSALFHRRNTTVGPRSHDQFGGAGMRAERPHHGRDLRASAPNGPVHRHEGAGPEMPSLEDARATVLGFGRFHGLTLGEVERREPTYIDWIASTITRDRDLVRRARVIAGDMDERGIDRRSRVATA
jgi:curved DNA-binding protein CbpA